MQHTRVQKPRRVIYLSSFCWKLLIPQNLSRPRKPLMSSEVVPRHHNQQKPDIKRYSPLERLPGGIWAFRKTKKWHRKPYHMINIRCNTQSCTISKTSYRSPGNSEIWLGADKGRLTNPSDGNPPQWPTPPAQ